MNFFEIAAVVYCSGWSVGFAVGLAYIHYDKDIGAAVNYQYFSRPAILGLLTTMSWLSAGIALYDFLKRRKRQ